MEPLIDLQSDQYFMGEALRQARRAWEQEEVPIGAVIVHQGTIIARACNQVETPEGRHRSRRNAGHRPGTESVIDTGGGREGGARVRSLYVTKEPCPMCAGALVHVRMKRVIFGCPSAKDGAGGSLLQLLQHPQLNHRCEITSGVRHDECAAMLQAFFRERRGP